MTTIDVQAKAIYDEFIRLHPNSIEKFDPTTGNISRWAYHIHSAKNAVRPKPMPLKPSKNAKAWAKQRAFKVWADMPLYMREKYLYIASHLPFVQVYATGSRVDGTYIELTSTDKERAFRKQLGKPDKLLSDYDVFANVQKGSFTLPTFADLQNTKTGKTILIPMWDFSKLPTEKHHEVIQLFEAQNWGELMVIHNTFALSEHVYCCDALPIIRYFSAAINNGTIKKKELKK